MEVILKLTNWKLIIFKETNYYSNYNDMWKMNGIIQLVTYSEKNSLNIITEVK